MNERKKLEEARFFLQHMEQSQSDIVSFGRFFSAFVSAARSVLQYAREEAITKGKKECWYDKKMNSSIVFRFFKNQRDLEIHQRPADLTKSVEISVPSTYIQITLSGGQKEDREFFSKTLFKYFSGGDVPIDDLDRARNMQSNCEIEQVNTGNGAVKDSYGFKKWIDMPKEFEIICDTADVLGFCKQYIDELEKFIDDGVRSNYITG